MIRMTQNDPVLLCDFGGTHGRLGIWDRADEGGVIKDLRKYKLQEYDTHTNLFRAYAQETGWEFETVAIAAADAHLEAHYHSGVKSNTKLEAASLKQEGYQARVILNDFEASAWGADGYAGEETILKKGMPGNKASESIAFIGPGTGLGFACLIPVRGQTYVHRTYGAHMRPCSLTAEHVKLLEDLQALQGRSVIYEDIACGRGLEAMYRLFEGRELDTPIRIFEAPQTGSHPRILRLFHEFLGLYIQNTMVTCHTYGGVVLHGGLLDVLFEYDLFDFSIVDKMLCQPYLSVVKDSIEHTPVSYINDTYLALHGLKNYLEAQDA